MSPSLRDNRLSDDRGPLRGEVQHRSHVWSLNTGQRREQQPQSGAVPLGPVREERAGRSLASPEQVQLFGLVAQRPAQVPPPPAAPLLQEALHLLLSLGGQVDVQTVVVLAVSFSACGNIKEISSLASATNKK